MSSPTTQPEHPGFAMLLAMEHAPSPGHTRASEIRLAWDGDAISGTLDKGEVIRVDLAAPFAIQVSRSVRRVEPGWIKRALGAEPFDQHRLHIELRPPQGARLQLCAVVEDSDRLEGLPSLDQKGFDLDGDALESLLVHALAAGGRVVRAADVSGTELPDAEDSVHTHVASAETRLLALREERDKQREQMSGLDHALRESQQREVEVLQRARELEATARSRASEIEAQSARLEAVQAEHRALTRELKRLQDENELLTIKQQPPPTASEHMKRLSDHNRDTGIDLRRMEGLGVKCTWCAAVQEPVEMVAWGPVMTAGWDKDDNVMRTNAKGGMVEYMGVEPVFRWRNAVCPSCGFTGRMFL